MASLEELENRIARVEERNRRVETDKAWETSWSRKIIIAALTYVTVVLFFLVAKLPKPWLNSLVPTVAFILSTLTIDHLKKQWLRRNKEQ